MVNRRPTCWVLRLALSSVTSAVYKPVRWQLSLEFEPDEVRDVSVHHHTSSMSSLPNLMHALVLGQLTPLNVIQVVLQLHGGLNKLVEAKPCLPRSP